MLKANETISQFVAELKKLSKRCEFGAWLEESRRDQFACGLSNENIRQRLFAEDMSYAKAYQLACSMEAAEKDAALVETRKSEAAIGIDSSSSVTAVCQSMAGAWRGKRDGQLRSSKERQQVQTQSSLRVRETPAAVVESSLSINRSQGSGSSKACRVCGGKATMQRWSAAILVLCVESVIDRGT